MDLETIIYEKEDNVAWITLNRPEVRNAQNETLRDDLAKALTEAKNDNEVYVIVITGAGDKAFSAGADINMFLSWTTVDVINTFKGEKRGGALVREITKPVIAMVNGLALGGGCELAMGCDIIVASENARLGLPEVSVGVIPGGGGTQVLPRLIGEKRAKEIIMTGSLMTAEEAYRVGLVNRVVPQEKLKETVIKITEKLKAKSPAILKIAKTSINKSLETSLAVGLECEKELFALCFGTEDQKEGAKAFLEKRTPDYKGR